MNRNDLPGPDPLEGLLAQAFAGALEELDSPALAERVLRRVRRRERLRSIVLGLVALLAAVLAAVLVAPVLSPLISSVTGLLLRPELDVHVSAATVTAILMLLVGPWLYALVEDTL